MTPRERTRRLHLLAATMTDAACASGLGPGPAGRLLVCMLKATPPPRRPAAGWFSVPVVPAAESLWASRELIADDVAVAFRFGGLAGGLSQGTGGNRCVPVSL